MNQRISVLAALIVFAALSRHLVHERTTKPKSMLLCSAS